MHGIAPTLEPSEHPAERETVVRIAILIRTIDRNSGNIGDARSRGAARMTAMIQSKVATAIEVTQLTFGSLGRSFITFLMAVACTICFAEVVTSLIVVVGRFGLGVLHDDGDCWCPYCLFHDAIRAVCTLGSGYNRYPGRFRHEHAMTTEACQPEMQIP